MSMALNPKCGVFFVAVVPQFVEPGPGAAGRVALLLCLYGVLCVPSGRASCCCCTARASSSAARACSGRSSASPGRRWSASACASPPRASRGPRTSARSATPCGRRTRWFDVPAPIAERTGRLHVALGTLEPAARHAARDGAADSLGREAIGAGIDGTVDPHDHVAARTARDSGDGQVAAHAAVVAQQLLVAGEQRDVVALGLDAQHAFAAAEAFPAVGAHAGVVGRLHAATVPDAHDSPAPYTRSLADTPSVTVGIVPQARSL